MKERFKAKDIRKYEGKNRLIYDFHPPFENLLNVTYRDECMTKVRLPGELFTSLIKNNRPNYIKLLPYDITVYELKRGNEWVGESNYLGINTGNKLMLFLDKDADHSTLSLLWILLHEFRHKIQEHNSYIESCQRNRNRKLWLSTFKDEDTALHVYHEIDPSEVDANTFACEILEVDYPGSKFGITKKRLKKLRYKV